MLNAAFSVANERLYLLFPQISLTFENSRSHDDSEQTEKHMDRRMYPNKGLSLANPYDNSKVTSAMVGTYSVIDVESNHRVYCSISRCLKEMYPCGRIELIYASNMCFKD